MFVTNHHEEIIGWWTQFLPPEPKFRQISETPTFEIRVNDTNNSSSPINYQQHRFPLIVIEEYFEIAETTMQNDLNLDAPSAVHRPRQILELLADRTELPKSIRILLLDTEECMVLAERMPERKSLRFRVTARTVCAQDADQAEFLFDRDEFIPIDMDAHDARDLERTIIAGASGMGNKEPMLQFIQQNACRRPKDNCKTVFHL